MTAELIPHPRAAATRCCPVCCKNLGSSQLSSHQFAALEPIKQQPETEKSSVFYLWPAHTERLLRAAAHHFQRLLKFMLLSGACDIGEAVYLDWERIDLDRAIVRFVRGQETDEVPLHYQVVAELRQHRRRHGAVFRGPDDFPYIKTERPACAIKTAFNSARRRAQLDGITIRDLRVTAAVWQLALTLHMPSKERMELLAQTSGWRDPRTLAKFERIPEVDLVFLALALSAEGIHAD